MALKIISLNCNGLREFSKREFLFNYFQILQADIVFLQETHCDSIKTAKKWSQGWAGKCFWSFGTNKSCGVGILVNRDLVNHVKSFKFDIEGRLISVNILINDEIYQFVNVYMPNNQVERKNFIKSMEVYCSSKNLFLGGDFNFVENINLDKRGGNDTLGTVGTKDLNVFKNAFGLCDIYRKLHPLVKDFTWNNGTVFCRLDRFYISSELINFVQNVEQIPSLKSDHDIVSLQLHNLFSKNKQGPGFWHCNVKILQDEKLKIEMKDYFDNVNHAGVKDSDWWETCKCKCKKIIIKHSVRISKEKKKALLDLETKLRCLHKKETENPGVCLNEINNLNIQLNNLLSDKLEGTKIRAKVNQLNNHEKPSKYFTKREKDRANAKLMKSLKTENGHVHSNEEIKSEVFKFYSTLFNYEAIDDEMATDFLKNLNKLSNVEKELCEGLITKEECYLAIKKMESGKSPGCDGLPAEFYKQFFHLFDDSFVQFINDCFFKGELSPSQKLGTITLLCKDTGKSELLGNWRPISLLNVDYKVVSKSLTNRLKNVIPSLVNIDQTCGVPGRSITDNLHLIKNVIQYVNDKYLPAAILSLDQAKAFDRVSHSFLFSALEAYGFGPEFIRWIKLLYNDVESQVLVNGYFTDKFPVLRSVRQGCSLSPLLYVLFIEPFAMKIRENINIKGISLPGTVEVAKISQYADDTNIFIRDLESGRIAFQIIKDFGKASGSLLALHKCWGIWLGAWRNKIEKPFGINWTNDVRKLCGVQFGNGDILSVNWNYVLDKVVKASNMFAMRNLNFTGKSKVIQSVLCSKLWYVGGVLEIPTEFVSKFEKIIFGLFWGNKPEWVNRQTVKLDFNNGGFEMVDIKLKIEALHVKHLISLFNSNAKWRYFVIYWIGLSLKKYDSSFASNLIPHADVMPVFYQNALMNFKKLVRDDDDFSKLTTKIIYLRLKSEKDVIPHIVHQFPRIDFKEVFKVVHHKFVDQDLRDVSWRVAHYIIPVNYYLYEKRKKNNCECELCVTGIETVVHLFACCAIVKPFWQFVEFVFNTYTSNNVSIKINSIIFGLIPKHSQSKFDNILHYFLSLGKHCIWTLRNIAKFENQKITSDRIIGLFIYNVRLRILADFQRFSRQNFNDIWCKNSSLVSLQNDKVKVVLKPP